MARIISSPGAGKKFDRMRKRFDLCGIDTRKEYALIKAKKSSLTRSHRDFVVASHEEYCERYNLDPCA